MGIDAEQLRLLDITGASNQLVRRLHPSTEIGGECADRPVAAPHHALPAEACDHVLDERTEVVNGPRRGGVGYDTRHLARNVWTRGDRADAIAPGIELAILDVCL